jgi:peptidyl-prolyl cis-trans isomerase D
MLTFFRRGLTAKLMLILLGLVLLAIVITGFGAGGMGLGELGSLRGGGVARVAGNAIQPEDVTEEANRQLDIIRQQQPDIDMASFIRQGGFEQVVDRLITYNANMAFGLKQGLIATKEMVDREIASIPAFQNLAGKFDDNLFRRALADRKISENQLRQDIARQLVQRQLLLPAAGSGMVPREVAYQYGSLLLESRSGTVGAVPVSAIPAGPAPTEAEVANFYRTNIGRYTIPERRVIRYALIGPEQVAGQAKATDAEIEAAYKAKADTYGARETRALQQVVLPTEAAAKAFAQKLASGTSFEQAAQQAGFAAGDIALGEQSRDAFAKISSPEVAAAAFSAAKGATTRPVKSSFGWHIVRVADIKTIPGKTLDQVRGELTAEVEQRKTQDALSDFTAKLEDSLSNGASFDEVARASHLTVQETVPVTAAGTAPGNPDWKAPEELRPMLEPAFAMAPEDAPTLAPIVPNQRFALVGVSRVIAAAAPPLAQLHDKVLADFVADRALARARTMATAIVAKINAGSPPAKAFADARLPAPHAVKAARRDVMNPQAPAPLEQKALFTLPAGKARLLPAPDGKGWLIVRLDSIERGDANKEPAVIPAVQREFAGLVGDEYASQFSNAILATTKVKRNEKAIAELRARMASGGSQ